MSSFNGNDQTTMPRLWADDVVFGYGRSNIVRSISLTLPPGDRVCLLGGNGSGKSTLIKGLFGLIPLRSGRIRLDGQDVGDLGAHKRFRLGMAYVPQDRRLFAHKSVRENLELACLSAGIAPAERARRADRVLETLPRLREQIAAPAGLLSGGEQQIVAIGRALMSEPVLLLLDESSAGLAPVWIDILYEVIEVIIEQFDLSMLLVEQNVHVGLDLTTHAHVLGNGVFALSGESAELKHDHNLIRTYLG
jgi:branched-chain amino acid transport system ATP-binding protein